MLLEGPSTSAAHRDLNQGFNPNSQPASITDEASLTLHLNFWILFCLFIFLFL